MKPIVVLILIIFFSSSIYKDKNAIDFGQRSFHYDSIPTTYLKTDSLELVTLLRDNDEVFEKRKGTKFRLIKKARCGRNSCYLISKAVPQCDTCAMPFYRKPCKGLFLILKDSKDKTIGTLKLAESFEMQCTTPWESRLTSRLTNDTTLVSKEISTACSDVGDLSCWDTVITTQWTITCDKIKLEKSEKVREGAK